MLKNFLFKKILSKNSRLHNLYKKETCYIFGNGYSLKYINLKKFEKKYSFTTGLNYLHKDFKFLNVVGDFHLHPGIFSPIWRHPYTKKISVLNKTRKFLNDTNRIQKNTNFFTSIYNFPFIKNSKNIFYLHNYGFNIDLTRVSPTSEFSLMSGSIFAMIGISAYMGFKNIIFVGMDYLSTNPKHGHFYEHGIRDYQVDVSNFTKNTKLVTDFYEKNYNCKFSYLSLKNSKSNLFENINYTNEFSDKEVYRENTELIDEKILNRLSKIEFKYLIYAKN